jgi:hypothetical protein
MLHLIFQLRRLMIAECAKSRSKAMVVVMVQTGMINTMWAP